MTFSQKQCQAVQPESLKTRIPVKAMPSMAPATALGALSEAALPAHRKGAAKGERNIEVKEELEVKTEPVESPEDEVTAYEEQPNHHLAQDNWDCDSASPKFGHCAWGGCIMMHPKKYQKTYVGQLHFSHASISMTYSELEVAKSM